MMPKRGMYVNVYFYLVIQRKFIDIRKTCLLFLILPNHIVRKTIFFSKSRPSKLNFLIISRIFIDNKIQKKRCKYF